MTKLSFDKKDVFTILNVEEAGEFVDTEGYFGNTLDELQRAIDNDYIDTLDHVYLQDQQPYTATRSCGCWALFIPTDKVKQKEKKWVACKSVGLLLTMINKKVGDTLIYRKKGEATIHNCIITEELFDDYCSFVILGSKQFSAKELFDDYEWRDKCSLNWCPFGEEIEVEVEE